MGGRHFTPQYFTRDILSHNNFEAWRNECFVRLMDCLTQITYIIELNLDKTFKFLFVENMYINTS